MASCLVDRTIVWTVLKELGHLYVALPRLEPRGCGEARIDPRNFIMYVYVHINKLVEYAISIQAFSRRASKLTSVPRLRLNRDVCTIRISRNRGLDFFKVRL